MLWGSTTSAKGASGSEETATKLTNEEMPRPTEHPRRGTLTTMVQDIQHEHEVRATMQ
jgi:hypothetical protein